MTTAVVRMIGVSVLSTLALAGCTWQSDYDALQAKYNQLEQQSAQQASQIAAQQQQIGRLQGAIKYTVNSDLLFASGSWEMSAAGQKLIAQFAAKLAPTQQNKIVVNGYTDNAPIGPSLIEKGITTNQDLSQKRAESVMQYIISQGVKPELISAVGHGDQDPVASNGTPGGRAANRRVELTLAGAAN
jgi:chemotaxis protein MotB